MSEIFKYSQLNIGDFDKIADALTPVKVPLEQSPIWGDFDNAVPGREFLGSFRYDDEAGRLVAMTSATLYRDKGRDWIWIKHGPLFAHVPNTATIQKMCSTLQAQFARTSKSQPLFVRLTMPNRIKSLRLPFEHTMYDQTVMVDLEKSEDEILAAMSQGGRRGIRKAAKEDLLVHQVPHTEALRDFEKVYYPIAKETGARDGFGIHPAKLYTKMLDALGPDICKLYAVSKGKEVLAWAITTEYRSQALYYYGASSREARDLHAPYLLHWEIIKTMKLRGDKTYDFMGIASKNYPSLANVTQFKLKFSKYIIDVPQTYDLPLQALKYKLLTTALHLKRQLL